MVFKFLQNILHCRPVEFFRKAQGREINVRQLFFKSVIGHKMVAYDTGDFCQFRIGVNVDNVDTGVLDSFSKLFVHGASGGSNDFSIFAHGIRCQYVADNTVLDRQFFIKGIASHFCQVIAARIEEQIVNQRFCRFDRSQITRL